MTQKKKPRATFLYSTGGIVVDSDPGTEIDEMLLKAAAPAAALDPGASISFASPAAPEQLRRRPLSPTPTS